MVSGQKIITKRIKIFQTLIILSCCRYSMAESHGVKESDINTEGQNMNSGCSAEFPAKDRGAGVCQVNGIVFSMKDSEDTLQESVFAF